MWQLVERKTGLPIEGSPSYLDSELSGLASEYLIASSKMGTFARSSMPASERAIRRAAGPLYQGAQGFAAVVESSGAPETAEWLGSVLGGQIARRIRGLSGDAIDTLGLFGPMRAGGAQ